MPSETISIKEAAEQLNVSPVSIYNWIKDGSLHTTDNILSQKDIDDFRDSSLNNKLSSRANKQYKNSHNHKLLTDKIIDDINSEMSGKDISDIYESSLSESYKNKEGIYYTPQYIIEDMMKDINGFSGKTFLDPCCGSGNFIIEAIRKGISPENVFGFDTDENAVAITKKRIKEICGYESNNIICADFLRDQTLSKIKFDYIFTNPPWGKKINRNDKIRFSELYNSGNSSDTSSLFYFASLKVLNKNGMIGFLLPDSFFNISSFEDARKSLLNLDINRLIDYGKPFKGLLTKAMAFVARHVDKKDDNLISCEIYNVKKHLRSQRSFSDIPKHILNFHTEEKDNDIIRRVFSLPHITLKDNTDWALGIITGNNNKLCSKEKTEGLVPIFRGKDIFQNRISEPTLFIDKSLEGCRQVADMKYYQAPEKIIYRFISNKIVCFYDTEQRYILNSANLFILKKDFPLTHQQVCDLLNSDFMNWLFKSIFNTHKILRSDLETLPIWHEYFQKHKNFSEETLREYLGLKGLKV